MQNSHFQPLKFGVVLLFSVFYYITYVERGLSTLLDGSQALVVDVSLQKFLQFSEAICDAGHQVVHPAQV